MIPGLEVRKKMIQAGLGNVPLDLLIDNVQVVNVYTGKIEPGAIGILDGRVITPFAQGYESDKAFDGGGRFAPY